MADILSTAYNLGGKGNVNTVIYDRDHVDEYGRIGSYIEYLKQNEADFAAKKEKQDKNSFLALFAAMVKHQNPLKEDLNLNDMFTPIYQMNTMEHTAQLLAKVEKLSDIVETHMTSNIEDRFAGKNVRIDTNEFTLHEGPDKEIIPAKINYSLDHDAYSMRIVITNDQGKPVFGRTISRDMELTEQDPSLDKGEHVWMWDGKDSMGDNLPSGNYQINMTYEKTDKTALRDEKGALLKDADGKIIYNYTATGETYGENGKKLSAKIFEYAIANSAKKEGAKMLVESNGKIFPLSQVQLIGGKDNLTNENKSADMASLLKLLNQIKQQDFNNIPAIDESI